MPNILVLGSGFAAVATIRELRRRKVTAPITVVSPTCELVYLPSLIWLPSGLRHGDDLRAPLEAFFRKHQVTWHQGRVLQVINNGRRIITDNGELDNDILVIATGGRYLRKLPGIEHAIIPCEGIASAEAIRDRLAALSGGHICVGFSSNPKEPGAVRGGPMFEFLFGIDTLLRQQGRRDHFTLHFFNPSQQPGQRLGGKAVSRMLAHMKARGIQTHLGQKPVRFEPDKVVTEAEEIPSDLTLFMPGLTGPQWLDESQLPLSEGGFIAADEFCRVKGLENVYVAGDAGSYPGPEWLAKQAHQADLQAVAVASNITSHLRGENQLSGFTSELACIVDGLDSGMLVYRRNQRVVVLPRNRLLHWAKRRFEQRYLAALK